MAKFLMRKLLLACQYPPEGWTTSPFSLGLPKECQLCARFDTLLWFVLLDAIPWTMDIPTIAVHGNLSLRSRLEGAT